MFKIELGVKVKSNVTGFSGITTSRSECLNGCNRYYINPPVKDDGTLPDGCWMDENELEVVPSNNTPIPRRSNSTGGPYSKIK